MLNTPRCSLENFCMHPAHVDSCSLLYVESLSVVCRTEPTPHPTPSKYVSTVPHFIKTDIVCNYTTKITLSNGDHSLQLNHKGISDSTVEKAVHVDPF